MGCDVFPEDRRDLVIAVEALTYLTLVFPFGMASEFHDACADALEAILRPIGVSDRRISVEIASVRSAPLTQLRNPELRKALETMEFMCGIELAYHSDLRVVHQANLSQFPHAPAPHYVAVHDARRAFGLPNRDPLFDYLREQ